MACCGGKGVATGDVAPRSFPVELVRFLFDALLSTLWIVLVHVAALANRTARDRRAELTAAVRSDLRRSASDLLDAPFLLDGRHRCRLSARLYPRSAVLAGLAYRYFFLALFAAFVAALAGVASASMLWFG